MFFSLQSKLRNSQIMKIPLERVVCSLQKDVAGEQWDVVQMISFLHLSYLLVPSFMGVY